MLRFSRIVYKDEIKNIIIVHTHKIVMSSLNFGFRGLLTSACVSPITASIQYNII